MSEAQTNGNAEESPLKRLEDTVRSLEVRLKNVETSVFGDPKVSAELDDESQRPPNDRSPLK